MLTFKKTKQSQRKLEVNPGGCILLLFSKPPDCIDKLRLLASPPSVLFPVLCDLCFGTLVWIQTSSPDSQGKFRFIIVLPVRGDVKDLEGFRGLASDAQAGLHPRYT